MPEPGKYITVFSSFDRCIVTLPSGALTDAAPILSNSNRKQYKGRLGQGLYVMMGLLPPGCYRGTKGLFAGPGKQARKHIRKQTCKALSADKKG